MTLRTAVPLAALSLLFGPGCYINVQDGGGGGPGWDDEVELCACDDNADCEDEQYCLRGFCREIPEGATTCSKSSDCGQLESCINGICTQRCAKTEDCSQPGCTCEDNYCVDDPDEHELDGGTGAPDAGPGGGGDGGTASCNKHSDCGGGAYCINGTCYLECQNDTHCPSAEECKAGVCQPKEEAPGTGCQSGADCGAGEDCVDGACRSPCGPNSSCPQGESCVIGYCTPASPPQGSGDPCSANCDCPSGETCQNGSCQL